MKAHRKIGRKRGTRTSMMMGRRSKSKSYLIGALALASLTVLSSFSRKTPEKLLGFSGVIDQDPIEWDFGDTTYGITIVHCNEAKTNMAWLDDVPKEWKITVYEKCGHSFSPASKPLKNIGSEECTAYLSTMIDQYDNLPDINLFVQADILLGFGKRGKLATQHSPFVHFPELVDYTHTWAKEGKGKFLAYGPEIDMMKNINRRLYFYHWYVKELFDRLGLEYTKDSTNIQGRSGACFAVHRDRILGNSVEKYKEMRESILNKEGDTNQILRECSTLENTWHLVLGESYIIPQESTLEHLWENFWIMFGRNKMMGKPGGFETKMDLVRKVWPGFSRGVNGGYRDRLVNMKK